jgi:hypothetical protein
MHRLKESVMIKEVNGYTVLERSFVTGEQPGQRYGIWGGREDFENDAGWDGCLDAVEYIVTGKVSVLPDEWYTTLECKSRDAQ